MAQFFGSNDSDGSSLLDRARQGDHGAFADLIGPSRQMAFTVCLRICGDEATALDALQEALISAWQHLDRFDGRARFSTWLYRIAHNAALMQVRQRSRQSAAVGAPVTEGQDPIALSDTVREVRWALAQLPPEYRAALVLREYADMSYSEIAAAQGIPENTVKSRLARARQAMVLLLSRD